MGGSLPCNVQRSLACESATCSMLWSKFNTCSKVRYDHQLLKQINNNKTTENQNIHSNEPLPCKNKTWVASITFLGCLSYISVTKKCYQVGFLEVGWRGFSSVTLASLLFREPIWLHSWHFYHNHPIKELLQKEMFKTTNLTRNADWSTGFHRRH